MFGHVACSGDNGTLDAAPCRSISSEKVVENEASTLHTAAENVLAPPCKEPDLPVPPSRMSEHSAAGSGVKDGSREAQVCLAFVVRGV